MFRDKRRDSTYFANYIAAKEKAIAEFTELLCKVEQQGNNPIGVKKCHIYLTIFLRDLMTAYYSIGKNIDDIRQVFKQYLLHMKVQDELTYNEALHVLSLAVLLEEDVYSIFDSIPFPEDALLSALIAYNRSHQIIPHNSCEMYVPEITGVLLRCLKGEATADDLKHFVSEEWYSLNVGEAWYDSDKRSTETYCGYWCFEGAAVAKMMGFEVSIFQGTDYFPVDLIQYPDTNAKM